MAESVTTTTTKGTKTVSKTVTNEQPGKAWIKNKKGKWVKPPAPTGDFAWDDETGWVAKGTAAQEYAMPLAIINSDPELQALFDEAWLDQKAGKEWTKDKFTVRLQSTTWFKTKSESERKYYTLANDPAQAEEFANQVKGKKSSIVSLANANGITLNDAQAAALADTALKLGYTDEQLTSVMADYINYDTTGTADAIASMSGSLAGRAGSAEDSIRDWAKRNMVTVSDSWVLDQVRASAKSGWNIGKATDTITNMAKQEFSHWADRLDGTTTLDDLSTSFKNVISEEFGENIKNIDFNNKFLREAMKAKDDKGMPIVSDSLRATLYKTDEWSNVLKNKNKIMATGRDLLTRMGF